MANSATNSSAANPILKYSYRNIWSVAYPILICLVMEQMIGMTDTAFLGRVGEIELGASAIAGIFYMVVFMAGFGFSIGAQIIIGRRNGERKYKNAGKVFWHGLYFLLAMAVALIVLTELLMPYLMTAMVSSEAVRGAAESYVRWRIPGLLFAFVTSMFRAFYVGTTQTKSLTLNSIIMVLSNVVFNYVLIFGKLGLPALGIAGAAIGSTLAEGVSLLFFVLYTRFRCDIRKFGLDRPAKFRLGELKSMMSVSVWSMVQHFFSVSTWFVFFLFVEHLGERSLAVSNIVRNISGLIWMVMMAFATTGSTLVSNMIGEGHQDSVMSLLKRIVKVSYLIICAILIGFAIFPKLVIGIYTDIPDLIDDTVPSMLVMCSAYLINVPAYTLFQAVSGTGNTRTAFILEMLTLFVYLVFCFVVIGVIKPDVAICWTGEHVYAIGMLLLFGWYMLSGRWKGRRI